MVCRWSFSTWAVYFLHIPSISCLGSTDYWLQVSHDLFIISYFFLVDLCSIRAVNWPCSFANTCAKTMDGFSGQDKPGVLVLFHLPWRLFPWLTGFQGGTRQSSFLWKLCLSSFCQMHSFCSYILVLVGEILPLAVKIGCVCCLVAFSSRSVPWFSWFFAYLQIKSNDGAAHLSICLFVCSLRRHEPDLKD